MNISRFDFLPTKLLESGIFLISVGVASIAWKFEQAIEVIEYLHNHGYTILGGDVYAYDRSSIKSTYDNWCHNESETEHDREAGRKKAIDYITKYQLRNGDNYIYDIVFSRK